MEIGSRDYFIALKLPTIYLHPVDDPQVSLLEQFFEEAPSPIPILGGVDAFEEGVTGIGSRYGNWQTAFPWPGGVITTGNLTVLSGE